MLSLDRSTDKDARHGREMVGVLGGEILALASLAAMLLDFGMALKVVGQAVGNNGTLLHHSDVCGNVAIDFMDE